jgi:hypothetical protein
LEWSPVGVRLYDGATNTECAYVSAADAGVAAGGGPVVLAVSRRSSFFRVLPLPTASRADLRQLLEFQSSTLFPIPIADLAFDFQGTDKVGPEGRKTLVAAIPTAELRRAIDELRAAGFSVIRVVPTAMGSALLAHDMGYPSAIVVENTPEGPAFDAIEGGELKATRVAPPNSPIDEEARRTAAMAGIDGAPVILAPGTTSEGTEVRATATPLAALVGPAAGKVGLDLEPRDIVEQRERSGRSRRRRLAALLAAAAALLVVLVYLHHTDAQAKTQRQRAAMNSSVNRLLGVQKAAEADAQRVTRDRQVVDLAFAPAQPLSDIVVVAAAEGTDGLWLTGISVDRGKQLLVRGTAITSEAVAEFLDRLGRNGRFRDVRLVFSNNATISATQVVQFSITAFPVGNIPLAETSTRRKT